ncbi:hypothetical protein QUF81_01830 [Peribacillus simplex]|uniref:hypothetical protein n=1 Tax=Peribacillus simplex TaxID=1478 RepID=UPI0025A099E1|nr:hypothetical protein [Peribacillus simplex]MDM5292013.1 hypothetical protein [Peribacillus simplex]
MGTLIKKIANYLVSHWSSLSAPVKWAVEQVAGWAVVEAISKGVTAVVNALSKLSTWAIEKIASLLGL